MLVGSVALAQQGLIIEPWRKVSAPAAAPVPPLRAMPRSGLDPVRDAASASRPQPVSVLPAPAEAKWSAPVVELLVDPWASHQVSAPAARRRWLPQTVEIIDPWANDATPEPPRVASRPAGAQHSTIF